MRVLLSVLFLIIWLSGKAVGQNQITKSDIETIEKKYQTCLNRGISMSVCSLNFLLSMDSCLNRAYRQLKESLPEPEQTLLKKDQLSWLKARDRDFKKIDSLNKEEGRDCEMFRYDLKAGYLKARNLALINRFSNSKAGLTFVDSLHLFKVYLESSASDNAHCFIKSIEVYPRNSKKLLQIIKPPENSSSCSMPKDQIFFSDDINFDGFGDFMIVQFYPAGPNIPHYYWKYNQTEKQFVRDTTLEDITSPEFDQRTKLVHSSWRKSCCERGASTYKYISGKITLIKEYEETIDESDSSRLILTTKKLINGKMTLVERTVEKRNEEN